MTDLDAGIRVLLVASAPETADALSRTVEEGYDDVALAVESDADAALDRLSGADIDCVVSAHGSGIDGLGLLSAVRERYPDLPFVLFSAEGGERLASDAIGAGVDDYLPVGEGDEDYERLAERVHETATRARSTVSYREVFEKANIGLTIRDVETGELLDVNERYCEMLGYSREEALSLSLSEITADIPGYTPQRARREIRAAIEEGSRTFEWPDRTADGDVLWVEISLTVAEIEGRERVLVTVRDITDRREREEALRESEERFRTLFERSVDAIFLHDGDGVILDANHRAAESLGYDHDDLIGRRIWEVSETTPEELSDFWGRISEDEIETADAVHRRADGSTFPVEVRVGQVDLHDGEQYVAIARDVTERVERERELERKNARLEEFASVVSHDLRNPLNVISGHAELARETGDDEHLAAIEEAADRMERLIDDLLALARRGEAIEGTEPVALAEVARRSWSAVATADATIEIDGSETISADGDRLAQLLENLFRNAIEHAGPGVTVRVGSLGDGAGFYVEDDGPGIPAEDRAEVFDRGYSTHEDGLGLGLSIVRRIAEAHGWEVDLTEGAEGGARFAFLVPG